MSAEEHLQYLARRRRTTWIVVIACTVATFFIFQALGNTSKGAWLEKASLKSLHEAEKKDPEDVDVLISLSHRLLEEGQGARAIPYMERAARLQPNTDRVWVGLARVQAMAGHAAESTRAYERAIQLNPNNAPARYAIAQTYGEAGLITDSLAQFDAAYKIDPGYEPNAHVWAQCLVKKGRWKEAWDHLLISLEKVPVQDTPCQILTDIGIKLNELDETEMRLRRRINFIRAYPSGVVRHALCRLLLYKSKDKKTLDEVEELSRVAITDQDPKPAYQAMLGRVLLLKGDVAGAHKAAQAALKLDPKDEESNLLLATIYDKQGRPQDAAAVRTRVAANRPKESPAVEVQRRAIQTAPKDAEAQLALAAALKAESRYGEAAEACHAALQAAPGNAQAQSLLAECRKAALSDLELKARAVVTAQ
jgi:tetratricopeptide (TPR) repeat protein